MPRKSKYVPMRFHASRHPSGRPVRNSEKVGQSIWRIPPDEPLTPRLRRRELEPCIGFTGGPFEEVDYDDEARKR